MNPFFLLCFFPILLASLLIDRKKLNEQKTRVKATYGIVTFLTFTLLITKMLHIKIPMPSRFFIHTVSPWISKLIGI